MFCNLAIVAVAFAVVIRTDRAMTGES